MRVLFSNPPWWLQDAVAELPDGTKVAGSIAGVRAGSRWPFSAFTRSTPDNFVPGDYLPYPFFMGYAASYLGREDGVDVELRDSIALRESLESYFKYLSENRFDYLFIESASPSWDTDQQIIRMIHSRFPDMRIVVTGPIASMGEKLLAELPIHAVIRGEYEKGAVRVINGAKGLIEFDLLSLEEMNAAPFPLYPHDTAHRYFDPNPVGQIFPHAQVWSKRGCPFKCIFCVWPANMTANDPDGSGQRRVRQYSADYMEAFLTELVARHGFKSVYFDDDTFNLGNAHVERVAGMIRKIGLPWSAMCRADTIRMETWAIMRESGCFGVKLGFESGNQFVVDHIVNKHLDLEYAGTVVHDLKRLGMSVHGTFTCGLPGETEAQMQDTKRYTASLPLTAFRNPAPPR